MSQKATKKKKTIDIILFIVKCFRVEKCITKCDKFLIIIFLLIMSFVVTQAVWTSKYRLAPNAPKKVINFFVNNIIGWKISSY